MSGPDARAGAGTGERVRVGLLGTGAISQIVHLPILTSRDDVAIRAVSDADEHRARAIAARFEVDRVVDDDTLLHDDEIDVVVICTPNHLHQDQAVAALRAGKHVLVERPLALDPEGAEAVLDAAREADRTLMVNLSHRFRPDVAALRAFVAGDELGRVYAVRGSWLNRKLPMGRSTWRQRPEEAGGGALMDLGIAALDLALWLLDYPKLERVVAVLERADLEVEDAATLLVETVGGTAVTMEVSWSYFGGEDRHFYRVLGLEGAGSLPPLQVYKQLGGRPMEVTPRQPSPRGGENPYTNAYRREIDHFLRTVRGTGETPLPTEQVELLRLIHAAYRSAETGREVRL